MAQGHWGRPEEPWRGRGTPPRTWEGPPALLKLWLRRKWEEEVRCSREVSWAAGDRGWAWVSSRGPGLSAPSGPVPHPHSARGEGTEGVWCDTLQPLLLDQVGRSWG